MLSYHDVNWWDNYKTYTPTVKMIDLDNGVYYVSYLAYIPGPITISVYFFPRFLP